MGSEEGDGAGTDAGTPSWKVALVGLAVFMVVAVLIGIAIPKGGSGTQRSSIPIPVPRSGKAPVASSAVDILFTVDGIDTASGVVRVRMAAIPGEALPAEGATLFTSAGAVPSLVIRKDQIEQERSAAVSFERGEVAQYPFDAYRAPIQFLTLAGADSSLSRLKERKVLPLQLTGESSASGLIVDAAFKVDAHSVTVLTLQIRRTRATVGWVLAMMTIYWALAILAACATFMVVTRRRSWETRLLAWLSALVFALIAFRSAAPGAPPVGTFLDFYAVFESVGIVALSLVVLMVLYLVGPRSRLDP